MRYARGLIPTALLAIAATAAVVACSSSGENEGATQAALKGGDPPGNNGTVKIQEVGDPEEIPDNDPHVGCRFQIEFRGFDQDAFTGDWALTAQPPSGQEKVVKSGSEPIGADPAGGANDVDAIKVVELTQADLAGLYEHPQQGFHLKLTVHAGGSQGADTKHKVFWVKGCPPPPETKPYCGNGKVETGEECDLGHALNGAPNSGCDEWCKKVPYCGDGCVDPGEECDDGADNGTMGSHCDKWCKKIPYCGDGCVDPGEECDDGADNGTMNSTCDKWCKLVCDDAGTPYHHDGGKTY